MVKDKNKHITGIHYNHLNLPTKIDFAFAPTETVTQGSISYIYDATGVKQSKTVTQSGPTIQIMPKKTLYAGNYVYEGNVNNETLKFFNHPEGYTEPVNTNDYSQGFKHIYQYKDHLGNIRLSYSDADNNGSIDPSTEILSEKNYYPFGLVQKGYNNVVSSNTNSTAEKYKYSGKEHEEELGKETYAFGWRDYDPAIARFNKIDRFAEKYYDKTPYHYAANNPMYFVDIQGDSLWIQHKGNKILYENGNLLNKDGTAYTGKGVKVQKDGSVKLSGFLKKAVNALGEINKGAEGSSMLTELQGSDNNFVIAKGSKSEFKADNNFKAYANQFATDPKQAKTYAMLQKAGKDFSGGSGGTIYWNTSGSPLVTLSGTKTNASTDLAHEMFHGLDANRGLLDDRLHNGLKRSEWQAVYRENTLRGQLGLPLRSHYKASLNASTGARTGLPPRMLSPAPVNSPILPSWYKK